MILPRNCAPIRGRSGFLLIGVLVVLVLISALSLTIVQMSFLAEERQVAQARRLQAQWLAESGLARARVQLLKDPDYTGEDWELTAEELKSLDPGSVQILISRVEDGRVQIDVQADYPVNSRYRHRVSRRYVGPPTQNGSEENQESVAP